MNDFYDYSGGVYSYVSGGYLGGHAVLLVGYNDDGAVFHREEQLGNLVGENRVFQDRLFRGERHYCSLGIGRSLTESAIPSEWRNGLCSNDVIRYNQRDHEHLVLVLHGRVHLQQRSFRSVSFRLGRQHKLGLAGCWDDQCLQIVVLPRNILCDNTGKMFGRHVRFSSFWSSSLGVTITCPSPGTPSNALTVEWRRQGYRRARRLAGRAQTQVLTTSILERPRIHPW